MLGSEERSMASPACIQITGEAENGFCSKVPTPSTPKDLTVPQAIAHAFGEFAKYLKRPKLDLAKAAQLAEELSNVLKNEPQEVDIVKARVLLAQLSRVCDATTVETRMGKLEDTVKAVKNASLGVASMYGAYLMGIPAMIYFAKLDSNNEISKAKNDTSIEMLALKGRIEVLESSRPSSVLDVRVLHQFQLDPPKQQESATPNAQELP